MKDAITAVAIAGAILCLVVYLALSLTPIILAIRKARAEMRQSSEDKAENKNAQLMALPSVVTAIATLVDSLAKAGPVLWALIGSMLFLLIAAFAAGLFPTP